MRTNHPLSAGGIGVFLGLGATAADFLAGFALDTGLGLTGLDAGATYHYRLVAMNETGISCAGDKTFQTPAGP